MAMAERITVELVRANRGERVLAEGTGDDIDSALAAFDAAVAAMDREPRGKMLVRARLDLDNGDVTIEGDAARGVEQARAEFDATRQEYGDGPGWGGSG
jgi:hypothetical protein